MIITKKSLPRRTFLRGLGTPWRCRCWIPWSPALAAPEPHRAPSRSVRMAFLYVPNGIIMKDWTPTAEGAGFEFTRTLKPVEPSATACWCLSGLDQYNGQALGDGAGDHARAGATWLTGVHPKKTQGADILAGIFGGPDRGQGDRQADDAAVARAGPGRQSHGRAAAIPAIAAPTATRFAGVRRPRRCRPRSIRAPCSSACSATARPPIRRLAPCRPGRTAAFSISSARTPRAWVWASAPATGAS